MKYKAEIEGHTVELSSCGTGSIDPWSLDYARSIDLSLMCTSDIGEFMLIDGDRIYKFERFNDCHELYTAIDLHIIENWKDFEEWLGDLDKRRLVLDFGTLEKSKKSLDATKRRSMVWKSIPEKKRREVYEHLKTLTREESEKWFEDKMKELNI